MPSVPGEDPLFMDLSAAATSSSDNSASHMDLSSSSRVGSSKSEVKLSNKDGKLSTLISVLLYTALKWFPISSTILSRQTKLSDCITF